MCLSNNPFDGIVGESLRLTQEYYYDPEDRPSKINSYLLLCASGDVSRVISGPDRTLLTTGWRVIKLGTTGEHSGKLISLGKPSMGTEIDSFIGFRFLIAPRELRHLP